MWLIVAGLLDIMHFTLIEISIILSTQMTAGITESDNSDHLLVCLYVSVQLYIGVKEVYNMLEQLYIFSGQQ